MTTLDVPYTHDLKLSDGSTLARVEVSMSVLYVNDADWRINAVYRDDYRIRNGRTVAYSVQLPKDDPVIAAIIREAEQSREFAASVIDYAEDNDCRRRAA